VWEPSRFGFVYALVRAYWRTGDEQYAEMFWQIVEDWREKNPPQQGPNWKCGQEISLRVMAWCFGLYGFLNAQATSGERVTRLVQMVAVSGYRIEANIGYALSQRNNHGISEATGLWTIGVLFPELEQAERWKERGRQILEELGANLIYEDGSFVQHSVNYHRLMLHDYIWSLRLGELHKQPFSEKLYQRIAMATTWLHQIQDALSEKVPNYGQNDGSLILPLSNCLYQDIRPVVQDAYHLCYGKRCFPDGPWDEELLWMAGPDALRSSVVPQERSDWQAQNGGYYVLRDTSGFVFVRCATLHDRPGHADMLHVDLWWHGQNIALDAGTYSYNAPAPWNNALAHTAVHNTVTVDHQDQMERLSKFFWSPWLHSRVHFCNRFQQKAFAYWEGEHDGYLRLKFPARHRRGIVNLGEGEWLVLDALESRGTHNYRLHWLFPDIHYTWDEQTGFLALQTADGPYYIQVGCLSGKGSYSLVRADQEHPRGWSCPSYYVREPALSLAFTIRANTIILWTLFSPYPARVLNKQNVLQIETVQQKKNVYLQRDTQRPLLAAISATSPTTEQRKGDVNGV
jgi:asparagine synthase (glutamine-hydrolysing)